VMKGVGADNRPKLRSMTFLALPLAPMAVWTVPAMLVTLCYQKAGRAVARIVARNSGRTVHSEHSGTEVRLCVQVACPGRSRGFS